MLLGGMGMAAWGGLKNRSHSMALGGFMLGACTVVLGAVPVFWIYLFMMAMIGLFIPLFNIPTTVLLQEKVEPDYLGRVFGVLEMIGSAVMPLGMLFFGPLSDTVRIEWLLIATGALLALESGTLLLSRTAVEAGKPPVREET